MSNCYVRIISKRVDESERVQRVKESSEMLKNHRDLIVCQRREESICELESRVLLSDVFNYANKEYLKTLKDYIPMKLKGCLKSLKIGGEQTLGPLASRILETSSPTKLEKNLIC
jgi:hypothetical protein